MLRSPSSSSSPACALGPAEPQAEGAMLKDEGGFVKSSSYPQQHPASPRSQQYPSAQQRPRKQNDLQQPDYSVSQEWPSGSYDSSNTSWESDWSASRGAKSDNSGGPSPFYSKYNSRGHTPSSYQQPDWPEAYDTMHNSSSSQSQSSYYDGNPAPDYYATGYGYQQDQPRYQQQQQYGSVHQQPYQGGPYNGNRHPPGCPPAKQQEYQRRQTRCGMDMIRTQIKREPDSDCVEVEGENFSSLFTKSLTSLYSQDTENTFEDAEKTYDSDVIVCNPTPGPIIEEGGGNTYQRLGPPPPGQYNPAYQGGTRNNFGFYETRPPPPPNCEPSIVQELGTGQDRSNAYRYDRPSFDDMHLYASSPPESKAQAKKRKLSMPNIAPEGGNYPPSENARRKAPRMMNFKSESKWTPNSFAFGDVQIKQEPMDDYTTEDLDAQNRSRAQYKEGPGGSANGGKGSGQSSEHPQKAAPRKRSPGATCFDRFEKKSTSTNKKVSPLSVYAKVQDCVVLNVKCRRYKKRTKAAPVKEEVSYPSKEEIENWKRSGAYSESPDQAVRHLMGDLMEQVCQYSDKKADAGPDLTQVDVLKVRELIFQFCQRYSLDYRDFEDTEQVLRPNIMKADKAAKNSLRASAIRKRTSASPVGPQKGTEPTEAKPPRTKRPSTEAAAASRRVLRSLPGRQDRSDSRQPRGRSKATPTPSVARRRYSTRSAKDVEESDVDIVIDSSTDRESEAGREAEVRKKSQRLRSRTPVETTPARESSKPAVAKRQPGANREEPRTRSREKKEADRAKDIAKAAPKKKWSRQHIGNSENSMSSSGDSVEIIGSTPPAPKESKPLACGESMAITRASAKALERIVGRSLRNNEEPSKSSKTGDEGKNAKPRDESADKNSKTLGEPEKCKTPKKENRAVKNEEPASSRSRRVAGRVTNKRARPASSRRGKVSEIEPLCVDDDSNTSKDSDCQNSLKNVDAISEATLLEGDMSADESKETVINPPEEESSDKPEPKDSSAEDKCKDESDTEDEKSSKAEDSGNKSDVAKLAKEPDVRVVHTDFPKRGESMLQVQLNRLPLKLDSKKRLFTIEAREPLVVLNKAETSVDVTENTSDGKENTELQNPPELVCMKETPVEKAEEPKASENISPEPNVPSEKPEISPNETESAPEIISIPEESSKKDEKAEQRPCLIVKPRYSESEDSDCGLVIDLDRRMSIEERAPSPAPPFQSSDKAKEPQTTEESLNLSVKKEPPVTLPFEDKSLADEEDCILLSDEQPLQLDSRSARFLESTAKSFSFADAVDSLEHAKKMKDQDESILRTLLLETADAASGVTQDLLSQTSVDSDISADSKASISQDVMKLLMYQTYHEVSSGTPCCPSPVFDDKKIPLDQLASDVNAQLLSDDECCVKDPRLLKEKIKKLKNEIVYLQCMIDQKDKERTAIICFKRYKEEVLKRVLKQYASNVQDHVRDWIRSRQESNPPDFRSSTRVATSVASTSSSSIHSISAESPHPQLSPAHQVIQLAYHATVKTDVPTSTVTSATSKKTSSQCSSESLPTVATMVAKATENYGVDMRTVRNGTSTTQTILQKVLSSKEAIYSPSACRSPSSTEKSNSNVKSSTTHHHQQQQQSLQIFQKTLSSSSSSSSSSSKESCFTPPGRRSPSLPELRPGKAPPHSQLLHKALSSSKDSSSSSSRSPPSLQPELRVVKPLTPSQKHPLDLIVNAAEKLESSSPKSLEPTKSGFEPPVKRGSSPKGGHESKHGSSPKRSSATSYSAWSSIHSRSTTTTTTTIDLRTTQDHARTHAQEQPLSLSKKPAVRSTGSPSFMVVPPPTTLQQSQKSSSSHPHEKSLKSSVERIYSRKTEEERRSLASYPSNVLSPSSSSLMFGSPSRSLSPVNVSNAAATVVAVASKQQPGGSSAPRCMGCGLSNAKFLCSGCRRHWYCSPECQSMRWPDHSKTCVGNLSVYS